MVLDRLRMIGTLRDPCELAILDRLTGEAEVCFQTKKD